MNKIKNSDVFPKPTLCLISASSGAGKTYLMTKMILKPNLLDFNNLIIYTTTPEQSYYQFLKGLEYLPKFKIDTLFDLYEEDEDLQNCEVEDLLDESIKNFYKKDKNELEKILNVIITSNQNDLNIDKVNPKLKNLVVFDDFIGNSCQNILNQYYIKGRHKNCSVFSLSQDFFSVDPLIRRNATCFIFFSLNERNLQDIIRCVNIGMDKNEFKRLCNNAWSNPLDRNYIFINTLKPANERVIENAFS